MVSGPLFVGEDYEVEREVLTLSGSRRTESIWTRARVYRPGGHETLAEMLLSTAILKDSYGPYEAEYQSIWCSAVK
jgi:hypothetical protein